MKRLRFPETFDPLKYKALLSKPWQSRAKLPSVFFHCCSESWEEAAHWLGLDSF